MFGCLKKKDENKLTSLLNKAEKAIQDAKRDREEKDLEEAQIRISKVKPRKKATTNLEKEGSDESKTACETQSSRPKSGQRKRKPDSRKSDKKVPKQPKRDFNSEKSVSQRIKS